MRATKEALGWDPDKHFYVPDGVYERFSAVERGAAAQAEWEQRFATLARGRRRACGRVGRRLGRQAAARASRDALPRLRAARTSSRRAPPGGETLQAIAPFLPTMVGGSADLNESRQDGHQGRRRRTAEAARRRATSTGAIREHGMGGAVNGLALHGGIVRPYGATFLQFADYMRGAIRLSALMRLHVAWVYTHDSVALGEDGPTHQPVEHLAALRAIPGLTVIRPSDATETAEAWRFMRRAARRPGRARALAARTCRCSTAPIRRARRAGSTRGAYVLAERPDAAATLVGTGSEVSLALEAQALLAGEGVQGARRRDAELGAVRRAGRRLPRVGAAARPAEGLRRGRHRDGLGAVGRRVRLDRALRRLGARRGRHARARA